MLDVRANGAFRPRMVFAYVDSAHAAQCGRFFRRNGWEVHLVADGFQAQRLVEYVGSSILVLDTGLIEKGEEQTWRQWLQNQVGLKVVLLAELCTEEAYQIQETFSAMALHSREDAVNALAATLLGEPLAEAV